MADRCAVANLNELPHGRFLRGAFDVALPMLQPLRAGWGQARRVAPLSIMHPLPPEAASQRNIAAT